MGLPRDPRLFYKLLLRKIYIYTCTCKGYGKVWANWAFYPLVLIPMGKFGVPKSGQKVGFGVIFWASASTNPIGMRVYDAPKNGLRLIVLK